MPLIPGQMIHGRYRVVSLMSQGGMGAVYEAMDTVLSVRCALKEMIPYPGTHGSALPELREQFRQEAQLLAGLRHPNLPRVGDHFEEDGNAYLVMDFVYGRRLDEVIAQEGRLAEEDVLAWARQLTEALAHCHEQGVIHRDVKPQNVIVTWQGQAVLVDFGLAKLVDPDDPRTRTVMRGLGTPEYAPPEQYDTKKGRTDARTDIYSLGATLYHALAGVPPPTVSERIVDPGSLESARELRDDISEVTDQVLMKAMALQPGQRFQSVAEMYRALFGSPLPTLVKTDSAPPSGMETSMLVDSSTSSTLLPWMRFPGLRVGRRFGWGLLAAVLMSLVVGISILVNSVSGGGVPTATPTASATATHTPTASLSPTPTPTASPTFGPPTEQPTETIDLLHMPFMASPTPAPTSTPSPTLPYVPRTTTPTQTPVPANTPTPGPVRQTSTPAPPTPVPTRVEDTPEPTVVQPTNTPDRPTPAPTPQ